jgi:hypothetical protein
MRFPILSPEGGGTTNFVKQMFFLDNSLRISIRSAGLGVFLDEVRPQSDDTLKRFDVGTERADKGRLPSHPNWCLDGKIDRIDFDSALCASAEARIEGKLMFEGGVHVPVRADRWWKRG